VLYTGAALVDGTADHPLYDITLVSRSGVIAWVGPTAQLPPAWSEQGHAVDASGSALLPAFVDSHTHVTLPGGARFMERGFDQREDLLSHVAHNLEIASRWGIRWQRDLGSPIRTDPSTGSVEALTLGRSTERLYQGSGAPRLAKAGAWIARSGFLPEGFPLHVADRAALLDAAKAQIEAGADLVKVMVDSGSSTDSAWSASDLRELVALCNAAGRKVAAHATTRAAAAAAVEAGVDSIEHGTDLDERTIDLMVEKGTYLVTTLSVYESWRSFGRTTDIPEYASEQGRVRSTRLGSLAAASARRASEAGVAIAAGTDAGGGSPRANQLAWEFELLVRAGITPRNALAAVTWRGGGLLGKEEAGRLRVGDPADFVLVHGDPLSDPRALWRIWWVSWLDEVSLRRMAE